MFIGKPNAHDVRPSVEKFIAKEAADGYHDVAVYENWQKEITALIGDLVMQISNLKKNGAKIASFAASAKGNTLLNACRFDSSTIDYIVDDTPEKIGRFSPGTGIPIVDRSVLASDPPDYLAILAWNFADVIIDSTVEYSGKGGNYIIPIPAFRIIESGDASE